MFNLNLSNFKKSLVILPISSLFVCYTNSYAEAVESSLTINAPEVAYSGDEIEITISKNVANQEEIQDLEFYMELPKDLYFKKSNLMSSNFKVKCDKSKKKAIFTLCKYQKLSLSPDSNELIRLKINVKKKASKDTNIPISFECLINKQSEKQVISKAILVNPKAEISNIIIDGKNFDFNKDKKDYEFKVPLDKESVDISVTRADVNNKESNETISKKLNKNTSKKFNIDDYQFTFIKEKEKSLEKKK